MRCLTVLFLLSAPVGIGAATPDPAWNAPPLHVFWEHHKTEIVVTLSVFCTSFLFLVVILFINSRHSRRLQAIFARLPVRVAVADGAGHVLFLEAEEDYLRRLPKKVRRLEDFPDDTREAFRLAVRQVLASGGTLVREYDSDGKRRRAEFIKLPAGIFPVECVLWASTDVSELHQANQVLHGVLDNLPAVIAAKEGTRPFRYVMWNKAAEKLTGISAGQALGRCDAELFPDPALAERHNRNTQEVCRSGNLKLSESFKTGSGELRELQTLLTRVNCGVAKTLVLVLSTDVTEERRLAAGLHIYADQQQLINSCLESVILDSDDHTAMLTVLRAVGERMGADRCFIFRYDGGNRSVIPLLEWHSAENGPVQDNLPQPQIPEGESWFTRLVADRLLLFPDVQSKEARVCLGEWGDYMVREKICSLCCAALGKEMLWGHLGLSFEHEKHDFSEQDTQLLRAAAHILEIILERKRNRDKLERSEYEKRLIMDTIHIPILLFNPDLKLIRINNAARLLGGLPDGETPPLPCCEYFCGQPLCSDNCPVWQTRLDLKEHSSEMRIKERDYLLSSYPIFIDGKLENILKTMVDVTEFNAARHDLTQALTEAQNANKAKSYFLATMSHELRTPLNAVIGFSELLQNSVMSHEEQTEYLQSINLAGNALLNLINDVLDLSKIEAGQMTIVPRPTDLAALLREIQAIFRHQTMAKQLFFNLNIPDHLPLFLLDSQRLRQILLNLAGNAVKFTEHGGVTITVTFDGGQLEIIVEDTGIGISDSFRKKIFEPFTQQDAIRHGETYRGTGLGLAISQRLVQTMGGEIEVESESGRGSKFFIRFRKAEFALPEVSVAAPERKLPELPEKALQVLVVDDVVTNRKVLEAMLRRLNVNVRCAASGREALEQISDHIPDLVLTDMWMPGMNGSELAAAIRADAALAGIRIAAVTADTEAGSNFKMEDFDAVFLKPVTQEKLGQLLSELREKHHKHTDVEPLEN